MKKDFVSETRQHIGEARASLTATTTRNAEARPEMGL
jgi:hypothetical protein